jgi:hypothetical protein
MTWTHPRRGAAVLTRVWPLAAVLLAPLAQAAAAEADFAGLVERYTSTLVTVKYVPQNETGERGQETEITGVVVDPNGLVLCSNVRLGGNPWGQGGITPTDIKLLIGDDTEGQPSEIVGRDSEHDLAWVQLTTPPARPLAFLNLDAPAPEVAVGQKVIGVRLTEKYFDRRPVVSDGLVRALLKKPRELVLLSTMDIDPGLPAFTEKGELIGIFAFQVPDRETATMSGGQIRARDLLFVLPAKKVLAQTRLAREQYEQRKAEEAANPSATSQTSQPASQPTSRPASRTTRQSYGFTAPELTARDPNAPTSQPASGTTRESYGFTTDQVATRDPNTREPTAPAGE